LCLTFTGLQGPSLFAKLHEENHFKKQNTENLLQMEKVKSEMNVTDQILLWPRMKSFN
jgi:hypothetical protein